MKRISLRLPLLAATALLILGWASVASAVVERVYDLTPGSQIVTPTPAGTFYSLLDGTGLVPTWIPGASATPPVNYGDDVPKVTLNQIRVRFSDDGAGNIVDGPIEIVVADWYNPIATNVPGLVDVSGLNDLILTGAVGQLNTVTGTVESWSSGLFGFTHSEITCQDLSATAICGVSGLGLPPNGATAVTHDHQSTLNIDVTGTDPVSVPMTFSNNYQDVTLEITLTGSSTTSNRQYYSIVGVNGTLVPNPVVPMLDLGGQLLLVALLAGGGVMLVGLRRRLA